MIKRLILLVLLLVCPVLGSAESAENLLDEIDRAITGEFYSRALSLLKTGSLLYPGDFRFPVAEGDLYSTRKLYNLALASYEKAETLDPLNHRVREDMASTLAFLDRNEEAIVYLEGLLEEGDDSNLADDLGWLYFKTHQPEKGISLLENILAGEFHKSLALTLGTLYSEIPNQELCRKYYLLAIDSALLSGESYFASVGYYNLSLAEQAFYSYEKAIEYARLSLEQMDRAGGHLALGDLYLMKGDYESAERETMKAVPLDKTPLSTLNLASIHRMKGELDIALREAESLRSDADDSWMYYYGIDSRQFDMDVNELLRDIHKGLYNRERLFPSRGIRGGLLKLFRAGRNYVLYRYYDTQFRILSFRVGRTQWERSSPLRGALTLAAASEGFEPTAVKYLSFARDQEADDPLSSPWYSLELGRERKDRELLGRAIADFQEEWEGRLVEECSREILYLSRRDRKSPSYRKSATAVYFQNPGGLVQYGLKLPLYLSVSGEDSSILNRLLKKQMNHSGFYLTPSYGGVEATLRVHSIGERSFTYSLTRADGSSVLSGRIDAERGRKDGVYDLVSSLTTSLFP